MNRLAFFAAGILAASAVLVGAPTADAQCCDRECFVPAGCEAPIHQSSHRCRAVADASNTEDDGSVGLPLTDGIAPPGGLPPGFLAAGCIDTDAGTCIGGSQAFQPEPPAGCVCIGENCVTDDSAPGTASASECTAAAIAGCDEFPQGLITTHDDPECPVCPQPAS